MNKLYFRGFRSLHRVEKGLVCHGKVKSVEKTFDYSLFQLRHPTLTVSLRNIWESSRSVYSILSWTSALRTSFGSLALRRHHPLGVNRSCYLATIVGVIQHDRMVPRSVTFTRAATLAPRKNWNQGQTWRQFMCLLWLSKTNTVATDVDKQEKCIVLLLIYF